MLDITSVIPSKHKRTASGWISFNAVCCEHNGDSRDKRQRGGIKQNGEDWSYHCFNCGFKASWQPGRPFSHKLRKLMQWLNAPDDVINKVALDVMRENEGVQAQARTVELPTFNVNKTRSEVSTAPVLKAPD